MRWSGSYQLDNQSGVFRLPNIGHTDAHFVTLLVALQANLNGSAGSEILL